MFGGHDGYAPGAHERDFVWVGDVVDAGQLRYTPFPDALRGHYQCHTQADLRALRKAGYTRTMTNVSTGVGLCAQWLLNPTDGLPAAGGKRATARRASVTR